MRIHTKLAAVVGLLALSAAGCGADDEKSSAPAPDVATGDETDVFALENGTYYITEMRDIQDGCGKDLLNSQDSALQVPFTLTNEANGWVSIDFCSYNDKSVRGAVRGNKGMLSVLHDNYREEVDGGVARFDRECRIDMTVTANNTFQGRFIEMQRGRNADQRRASGVDQAECATSFTFTMKKRD